jgi:hypothetical protein
VRPVYPAPMRDLWRLGESALLLVAIMVAGSVLLWVGVPVGWLWVGSQVQASTGSLGAALAVALVGTLVCIALMVIVLAWLAERHRAVREERGQEDLGQLPLEVVMVCSAAVALVGFGAWFLLFAGASPIPLNVGA